ncbi:DUF441 domain-containing protein [Paenibacillus thiaminolyticus]|uniref:UPF0756 membrane protein DQX05_11415 n=1 Tax=Paenibacillus thiaminolyticus TaxID=49283 RepID=A0A378ZLL9_PANTH|nr:DUF441 domain-containing protein [Paenibacillus thiaminolyticus]MCY9536349.1 DUF441 domain-containing protein [Paenibacillus thiaminolyticus]MCY9601361.1 DUF441 domain-containing protein [Paenibacillus thiaminolyticus]MCY9609317.1 DUF441 domain-containing protein [Paenibacillus thiaminolyticus]MCY9613016.1 DUF441 domain-containing protein [Paenibacillus thiaminolyticus]MCY9617000.1 DUF441 domain-containing protein [Paenibacillus thiaminolyticus]
MNGELVLVVLIVVGLVSRSPIITTAACILLIVKLVHLERYLPAIERRGLELGLLFLTIAVLVPFAAERITSEHLWSTLTSWPGIIALAGGAIATSMNGRGLELLKTDPQMIVGLVAGSLIGIILLRGVPVGPLMAAGITALLLTISRWIIDKF